MPTTATAATAENALGHKYVFIAGREVRVLNVLGPRSVCMGANAAAVEIVGVFKYVSTIDGDPNAVLVWAHKYAYMPVVGAAVSNARNHKKALLYGYDERCVFFLSGD